MTPPAFRPARALDWGGPDVSVQIALSCVLGRRTLWRLGFYAGRMVDKLAALPEAAVRSIGRAAKRIA